MATNSEFAGAVGCHFTTASRIRNGERMPSAAMFARIIEAYGLDPVEAWSTYARGRPVTADYLKHRVFEREVVAA